MELRERVEKAKEVLGRGARVKKYRSSPKKKTKPLSSFIPRKTRGRRDMSRSEYQQCGKKDRYGSETEARKYAAKLSTLRGYEIRVYGPCPYCNGGFHLTHIPRRQHR